MPVHKTACSIAPSHIHRRGGVATSGPTLHGDCDCRARRHSLHQMLAFTKGGSMTRRVISRTMVMFVIAFLIAGCNSSPKKADSISISISPSTASVQTGQTKQFTANLTGSTNTGVSWSVVGGSANGSISASGLYTAPDTVPSGGTVTVSATAQADATKIATATVTVTSPAISVSVSP